MQKKIKITHILLAIRMCNENALNLQVKMDEITGVPSTVLRRVSALELNVNNWTKPQVQKNSTSDVTCVQKNNDLCNGYKFFFCWDDVYATFCVAFENQYRWHPFSIFKSSTHISVPPFDNTLRNDTTNDDEYINLHSSNSFTRHFNAGFILVVHPFIWYNKTHVISIT